MIVCVVAALAVATVEVLEREHRAGRFGNGCTAGDGSSVRWADGAPKASHPDRQGHYGETKGPSEHQGQGVVREDRIKISGQLAGKQRALDQQG
ncbi:hypothetical protein D3C86_1872390 [compost metagenome]